MGSFFQNVSNISIWSPQTEPSLVCFGLIWSSYSYPIDLKKLLNPKMLLNLILILFLSDFLFVFYWL